MQAVPVRAPTSGRIVSFNVVPGQVVHRDEPLFEIHDLSRVWVKGNVFERDAGRVELGQAAQCAFSGLSRAAGHRHGGAGSLPRWTRESGCLPVWIEVDNTEHLLKDGMLARVTLMAEPADG